MIRQTSDGGIDIFETEIDGETIQWDNGLTYARHLQTAQLLSAHFSIEGRQALQFVAFALLPAACIGSVLGAMRPDFGWRRPAAA